MGDALGLLETIKYFKMGGKKKGMKEFLSKARKKLKAIKRAKYG